jgi:hypothetical protein
VGSATCAENCPGPATQKGCLTARQELSRQRVGLASPDNSDTHDSNGGRGRRGSGEELRATHRRHRTGADGVTGYTVAAPVEDWRRRAAAPVEDREPADIEEARSRSHGLAAVRPALGLGEPESTHRSRLKPGLAGRRPRLAVTGVLICAVGALVITPGI